jgi:uncharacterized coiled-coil DUF342 family protein
MSKRDAYVKKVQAKLDEWNAEIDKLEAKARAAQADAQIDLQQRVAELRSKRDEMTVKLQRLRDATEGAWEDLKAGLELAWEALGEAVHSAKSHFKS